MSCPDCSNDRTRVRDTAANTNGDAVRRRRECQRCSFRVTTYERPEWDSLQVKKRDGNIEPYDQQKVREGIIRAVKKRPVADAQVTELVDSIEAHLQTRDERIVASSLIGALVSDNLRELDKVAHVRFVSVYKGYSDPEDFRTVTVFWLPMTLQSLRHHHDTIRIHNELPDQYQYNPSTPLGGVQ